MASDTLHTEENTTKKEMWLGYVLGVWGMMMTSSIVNSYFNQYLTDVIGFDSRHIPHGVRNAVVQVKRNHDPDGLMNRFRKGHPKQQNHTDQNKGS